MQFSIVIPVYNVAPYLRECVDSVLAQNSTDYEIILVDDGSTDNSPAICDEYAQKYNQIKVIHKVNRGPSDSRNIGIKEAKGDYLIFIDADDFWKGTNVLSDLSTIIVRSNPDMVIFFISYFYSDNKVLIKKILTKDIHLSFNLKEDFLTLVNNNSYLASPCDKVIRTSIIKNNNITFPKGKLHEDVAWCADIIPYVDTYAIYENSFYYYRKQREGSTTNSISKKNIIDIINIIIEKQEFLLKIIGGLEFLAYHYFSTLRMMFFLKKEEQNTFFSRLNKIKYLLKYIPKKALTSNEKFVLYLYKTLGLKNGMRIEKKIRELLQLLKND